MLLTTFYKGLYGEMPELILIVQESNWLRYNLVCMSECMSQLLMNCNSLSSLIEPIIGIFPNMLVGSCSLIS